MNNKPKDAVRLVLSFALSILASIVANILTGHP